MGSPSTTTTPERLSGLELEHYQRALDYLKATNYLADLGAPEWVYEGRYAARGVIVLADALSCERASNAARAARLTQDVADSFGEVA